MILDVYAQGLQPAEAYHDLTAFYIDHNLLEYVVPEIDLSDWGTSLLKLRRASIPVGDTPEFIEEEERWHNRRFTLADFKTFINRNGFKFLSCLSVYGLNGQLQTPYLDRRLRFEFSNNYPTQKIRLIYSSILLIAFLEGDTTESSELEDFFSFLGSISWF